MWAPATAHRAGEGEALVRLKPTRVLLAGSLSAALFVLSPAAGSGALAGNLPVPKIKVGAAMYDAPFHNSFNAADIAVSAAAAPKLATFTASVVDSGITYKYTMVGKNPSVKLTKPTTTVTAQLIPLLIKFPDGASWDPTVADSCDSGASALVRTQQSPVFVGHPWTWGGTSIGTGQYVDAFQRASFWKDTMPTGINPGYHVNLALTTLPTVTINVPLADAAEATTFCGNFLLGLVNVNWLDAYLKKTVIPSLASQGVGPSTFPLFLVHNVGEYIGTVGQCCVLGYHNAYKATTTSPIQSYGLSMYDNSSDFTGSSDISALSHEVGEWVNDPYTNNKTRAWGHIGQVRGCQKNLEVGDPLSSTNISDTVGGFTYNPQELAFESWFHRVTPSLGVNGWYSNNGTFTTTQATCV